MIDIYEPDPNEIPDNINYYNEIGLAIENDNELLEEDIDDVDMALQEAYNIDDAVDDIISEIENEINTNNKI